MVVCPVYGRSADQEQSVSIPAAPLLLRPIAAPLTDVLAFLPKKSQNSAQKLTCCYPTVGKDEAKMLMEAPMDPTDPFATTIPAPTAARPLLGLTILVIEDSRYACEAMRLLCLRSGARIRRADCLRSARRHLRVYRPTVVMIDLGLPDGSGLDLIRELRDSHPPADAVLAMSADDHMMKSARDAGAHGFLAKPIESLGAFQAAILRHLPKNRQPPAPRDVPNDVIRPDAAAYHDDLQHVIQILSDTPDAKALNYVAQFLQGFAITCHDDDMIQAASALSAANGNDSGGEIAKLSKIVSARLAQE